MPTDTRPALTDTQVANGGRPSLTDTQVRTIKGIVRVFEGGKPQGDYAALANHPDDPGGLSFGACQATLNSGNLYALLREYCELDDATAAHEVRAYLPMLRDHSQSLNGDRVLHRALQETAKDPAMQRLQEEFFNTRFWLPAKAYAESIGCTQALSFAVLYDSTVHGSRDRLVQKTEDYAGRLRDKGEQVWIHEYLRKRKEWLGTRQSPLLRRTVYRPNAFASLIAQGNWSLALPLAVCGVVLNEGNIPCK